MSTNKTKIIKINLPGYQKGISLIELIFYIVIVGIAIAGILGPIGLVTKSSADPFVQKQSMSIAESLLEEIEAHPLGGGSCTGTLGVNAARNLSNNVCDYNGYSTTGGVLDYSSNLPKGLSSYNIQNVTIVPVLTLNGMPIQAGSAVEISVTVRGATGQNVTEVGYRIGL